jgi:hypothetical protein
VPSLPLLLLNMKRVPSEQCGFVHNVSTDHNRRESRTYDSGTFLPILLWWAVEKGQPSSKYRSVEAKKPALVVDGRL